MRVKVTLLGELRRARGHVACDPCAAACGVMPLQGENLRAWVPCAAARAEMRSDLSVPCGGADWKAGPILADIDISAPSGLMFQPPWID